MRRNEDKLFAQECLRLAVQSTAGQGLGTDDVVKRAEGFYAFVFGQGEGSILIEDCKFTPAPGEDQEGEGPKD